MHLLDLDGEDTKPAERENHYEHEAGRQRDSDRGPSE